MPEQTSLDVVLDAFRERVDPTEPLTTAEVAEGLDCTRRTAYNKLTALADRGDLQTKKVGARGRVWWQRRDGLSADDGRQADLLDGLFESSPTGIVVFNPDGSIARANQHVRELLTEREGTDVTDYSVGDAEVYDADGNPIPPSERPYLRVFETGEPIYDIELRVTDASGEPRWLLVNATPIFDSGGDVANVLVTGRNVTPLKEQEQQFREIVEHVGDFIWISTADASEVLYINSAFEAVHGTPCEAVYEDSAAVLENIHPDDVADVEAVLEAMATDAAGGDVRDRYPYEYRVVQPDGSVRWVEGAAYPIRDETGTPYRFTGISMDVTDHRERERRIARQRDELARVERLNTVIRDITATIVGAETRDEIEETICERLAAEPAYAYAWVGGTERRSDAVVLRAWAGRETGQSDYRFECEPNSVRVDAGPTKQAAQTSALRVVSDVFDEPDGTPWSDRARALGIRSVASVPLVYNRRLFGVLTLSARWPGAFGPKEQTVLTELGRAIGHAINALEWKDMILSERVVELELESKDLAAPFTEAAEGPVTLEIDRVVPLRDHTLLQYFTLTGISPVAYLDVLSTFPSTLDARIVSQHDDAFTVEIHTSEEGLGAVITRFGGRAVETTVEDGVLRTRTELPPSADVRQVVEAVREVYPDMSLRSQQTTSRPRQTPQEFRTAVESRLTERQHSALVMAYYGGYLEWPRDSTGEDLAASMGVAPPTFHKHLRTGERKLLEVLFEPSETDTTLIN